MLGPNASFTRGARCAHAATPAPASHTPSPFHAPLPSLPQNFSDVFPHLIAASDVGALVKIADVDFDQVDAVFCCLPHATTQQIIKSLPTHLKIVDLSADFRLRDVNTYAEWWVQLRHCSMCGLFLAELENGGWVVDGAAFGPIQTCHEGHGACRPSCSGQGVASALAPADACPPAISMRLWFTAMPLPQVRQRARGA